MWEVEEGASVEGQREHGRAGDEEEVDVEGGAVGVEVHGGLIGYGFERGVLDKG